VFVLIVVCAQIANSKYCIPGTTYMNVCNVNTKF
jgi:hypothetical protein